MKRILFVPNTVVQMEKFRVAAGKLPRAVGYKMVIIDRFKSDSILPEARRLRLPYVELESMHDDYIRGLLERESAGLVVVGNDVEVISRAFIRAARAAGIPSLLLQDGAICQHVHVLPLSLDYLSVILSIYGPAYLLTHSLPKILPGRRRKATDIYKYGTFAEYAAVWGDFTKRAFVALGAKGANVRVTGSPDLDKASRKGVSRERIFREIGADPAKKTILFAPTDVLGSRLYTRKEYREMCDAVCGAVEGQDDVQIIIKPHYSFYRREPRYFERYLSRNVFFSMQNPYDLLSVADALVAEVSTMLAEAAAFGVPALVVNLTGRDFPCGPYPRVCIDRGVALLATDRTECREMMHDILFDRGLVGAMRKKQPAFIRDQFYKLDGKSAQRAADLVMELLGKAAGGR